MDFWDLPNEQSARRVFYSLIGVGGDNLEVVRAVARKWLDSGEAGIANHSNLVNFPPPYVDKGTLIK